MDVITFTDKEMIAHALSMWANYIETGSVTMSAADATNQSKYKLIRGLNTDQQKFVIRLREKTIDVL
ncbi:hypothetical protein LCGC14_2211340 [marine sediment metagenome]|uniref:Uncharacterized protein n=1 Tax=marine sediment metagenome TaxID=412755 RepID=A0A0F9E175_9ZZZZ